MLHVNKQRSLFISVIFGLITATSTMVQAASPQRVEEVAQRGAHVMPFDLKQTQHIFSKTETGGVQQVLARDPANAQQIELVRQHLRKISQEFSHGDFSDPAKIHGEDMPGLAELRNAKPGQLNVEYKDLKDGAQITYSSADSSVIAGIHKWFDSQLADHGPDAMPGHPHGAMHNMQKLHDMERIRQK